MEPNKMLFGEKITINRHLPTGALKPASIQTTLARSLLNHIQDLLIFYWDLGAIFMSGILHSHPHPQLRTELATRLLK